MCFSCYQKRIKFIAIGLILFALTRYLNLLFVREYAYGFGFKLLNIVLHDYRIFFVFLGYHRAVRL